MTVTQKMIAREAGVGQSWVSWVLRDAPRAMELTSETRDKIKRIAHERGYIVDAAASTMRSGVNASTVALLCEAEIQSEFFIRLIIQLNEHSFGVRIYACENLKKSFTDIVANRIRYIINFSFSDKKISESADLAEKYHLKMAFATPYESDVRFPTFSSDNRLIMHELVYYLHGLGHNKIALFCGPHEKSRSTLIRHTAFLEGLEFCGLNPDSSFVCCEEYSDAELIRFLLKKEPTAIAVIYPGLAVKIIHALTSIGLEVPDDLSLISFGSLFNKNMTRPVLTSMSEDSPEGRLNAILGYFLDDTNRKYPSVYFPGSLNIGGSTAPPNASSILIERLKEVAKLVDLTKNFEIIQSYRKLREPLFIRAKS